MSGSEASNLGYSEYLPNSNINGAFVNVNNTNNPANFGSNEVPPTGLGGASCNMDAAAGIVPGICMSGGGKKRLSKMRTMKNMKNMKTMKLLKRKIKNISNMYKMKYTKKQRKQIKRKISKKYVKRSRTYRTSRTYRKHRMGKRMRKMQKGGAMTDLAYSNYPNSEDYSGTKLSYNEANASSGYGFQVPSSDPQINSALSSPTPIAGYGNIN